MILEVVNYGHPALRKKGERLESVTPAARKFIADMFETMCDFKGIGLAAQQVGVAWQLAVIDVRGVTDRPSTLELNGKPAPVDDFMPLVLINPEVKPAGNAVPGPEGCLSFPEIYADITRPESVDVNALNDAGEMVRFRCGGLLARAVQHEVDHLNGILFIDRMTRKDKEELRAELDWLQSETKAELKKKGPSKTGRQSAQ